VQGGRVHEGLETGEFDGAQAHAVIGGSSGGAHAAGDRALCQTVAVAAMRSGVPNSFKYIYYVFVYSVIASIDSA
jgi:hypothetical protein